MAEFDEDIAGISFVVSKGNRVFVVDDSGLRYLNIEDVFKLAEFAGAAHTALTGAEYVHAEYDKGDFVVKEGVPALKKRAAPMPGLDALEELERDCE